MPENSSKKQGKDTEINAVPSDLPHLRWEKASITHSSEMKMDSTSLEERDFSREERRGSRSLASCRFKLDLSFEENKEEMLPAPHVPSI